MKIQAGKHYRGGYCDGYLIVVGNLKIYFWKPVFDKLFRFDGYRRRGNTWFLVRIFGFGITVDYFPAVRKK